MSTAESDPQIKEASPRRRSMMISKCRKVWAWLNSPRKIPLGDHDKIIIGYQLNMHLVSDKDHVTPWISTNLNRKEICPSMASNVWKIGQPQIIRHQIYDPSNPNPQLNQADFDNQISVDMWTSERLHASTIYFIDEFLSL